jgi:cell division protein FtsQ
VAKFDSSTRGTTFVDDEQDDAYLRPAAPSSPVAKKRVRRAVADDRMSDRLLDKAADNLGRSDEDEPFLRTRRRVPIKKGILPEWTRSRWGRIVLAGAALAVLAGGVAVGISIKHFVDEDPRFRIDSAASIQTVGNSQLTREDLLSVFGEDLGRNIFYVPLTQRRKELEQIPWVQNATVMRLLPNELRVAVVERTPIAFVRVGDKVQLVDADGVILDMPAAMMAARHFSFPVVTGIRPGDPLSTRKPRMTIYQKFLADLDASGEKLSEQLSEIDLSDAEDVRATIPAQGSDLLLHFGDEKFLARYRVYQSHLKDWETQYPHLASVDLRYDGQVVLKMADGKSADAVNNNANLTAAPDAAPVADAAKPTTTPAAKPVGKSAAAKKHLAAVMAAKHHRKAKR